MTLANTTKRTFAALAASFFLVPLLWAQAPPAPKTAKKSKPASTANKTTAAAKPVAPAKSAKSATAAPSSIGAPPPEKPEPVAAKRDPFNPLITDRKESAAAQHLPPGKGGLVVGTVRVDGTVRSGDGMMIAVLANPDDRVYFVREGDQLYDGSVEKISLDGVTFRENSKDAFGKPVERVVTKRIYASAGAQQ